MYIQIYIHQGDQVFLTLGLQTLSLKENYWGCSFMIRSLPGECGIRRNWFCDSAVPGSRLSQPEASVSAGGCMCRPEWRMGHGHQWALPTLASLILLFPTPFGLAHQILGQASQISKRQYFCLLKRNVLDHHMSNDQLTKSLSHQNPAFINYWKSF